jgi:hypothetical protein
MISKSCGDVDEIRKSSNPGTPKHTQERSSSSREGLPDFQYDAHAIPGDAVIFNDALFAAQALVSYTALRITGSSPTVSRLLAFLKPLPLELMKAKQGVLKSAKQITKPAATVPI